MNLNQANQDLSSYEVLANKLDQYETEVHEFNKISTQEVNKITELKNILLVSKDSFYYDLINFFFNSLRIKKSTQGIDLEKGREVTYLETTLYAHDTYFIPKKFQFSNFDYVPLFKSSIKSSKALFLDRDGIIIKDKKYQYKPDEIEIIKEATELIKFANRNKIKVFGLTNQAGVARNKFSEEHVYNLHSYLSKKLKEYGCFIDDWFISFSHPESNNQKYKKDLYFRKPHPGMLQKCCMKHGVELSSSLMIGDKTSDDFTQFGLKTFLLKGDYDLSKSPDKIIFKSFEQLYQKVINFYSGESVEP